MKAVCEGPRQGRAIHSRVEWPFYIREVRVKRNSLTFELEGSIHAVGRTARGLRNYCMCQRGH